MTPPTQEAPAIERSEGTVNAAAPTTPPTQEAPAIEWAEEVLTTPTRAEVCVVACAEAWRGDGEVLAAAMGTCSILGARLARMTFEPGLLTTDGGALLTAEAIPLGADPGPVEGGLPFRDHLWLVAAGRRHVMMGASQIDRYGNTNISAIGDWARPKAQLLGSRGAPGNTRCNPTSYWIPRHSPRVFVEKVDFVSGVGTDRGAFDLRRVVTDLAVLDFGGPDGTLRLVSVHPGVTVDAVVAATGFDLAVPAVVPPTRTPDEEELRLLRAFLDPKAQRDREVPVTERSEGTDKHSTLVTGATKEAP